MDRISKRTLFGLTALGFFAVIEIGIVAVAVLVALHVTFGVPIPFVG